jgi:hypothetical protein
MPGTQDFNFTRNERVVCSDGFSLSVQASAGLYCTPRSTRATSYSEVECVYPSAPEPLLYRWADAAEHGPADVYGYVPSHIVRAVIDKHGGVRSGQLPPLDCDTWKTDD